MYNDIVALNSSFSVRGVCSLESEAGEARVEVLGGRVGRLLLVLPSSWVVLVASSVLANMVASLMANMVASLMANMVANLMANMVPNLITTSTTQLEGSTSSSLPTRPPSISTLASPASDSRLQTPRTEKLLLRATIALYGNRHLWKSNKR